jgi:hypothetical protein
VTATLTRREVGRLRVANHRLVGSTLKSPLEAARLLLAAQAQDFASACWSLGLRAPGVTEAAVIAAFASGEVVRSWPLRGTLHVTAAEDLPWLLELLSPRALKLTTSRHRELDLTEKTLERAREVAHRLLAGRKALTRTALLAALEERDISTAGQRGYHVLLHLSLTGSLCFGPLEGDAQTFVLLAEWVRAPRSFTSDEALGELARRFFVSHGPASLKDFVGWTGLTLGQGRLGLSLARPHLEAVTCDGVELFMSNRAGAVLAATRSDVEDEALLLPGFDEYVLGYKDRSAVMTPAQFQAVVPGGNGVFRSTLVLDGQVAGTWRRTVKTKECVVHLEPFEPLSRANTRKVTRAFERYAHFIDLPVRLS